MLLYDNVISSLVNTLEQSDSQVVEQYYGCEMDDHYKHGMCLCTRACCVLLLTVGAYDITMF